jgi:CO/xanthine dehydrogenase FAD-binding subunit
MIIEYQRPKTINEALTLLAREQPRSYPLGGGTVLNQGMQDEYAVIDLQALGLASITQKGNVLHIGASATLQSLLEYEGLSEDIYKTIKLEATYNLRQMATVAGTLVSASGRSPFTTALLALDAGLEIHLLNSKPKNVKLGDWLPVRGGMKAGELITMCKIPTTIRFAYESVARTPADRPIICVAMCQWSSGRTRLTVGGWGGAPILAMDGPEPQGIDIAAKNATSLAEDEWASSAYRQEIAGVLAMRCMKRLTSTSV